MVTEIKKSHNWKLEWVGDVCVCVYIRAHSYYNFKATLPTTTTHAERERIISCRSFLLSSRALPCSNAPHPGTKLGVPQWL